MRRSVALIAAAAVGIAVARVCDLNQWVYDANSKPLRVAWK